MAVFLAMCHSCVPCPVPESLPAKFGAPEGLVLSSLSGQGLSVGGPYFFALNFCIGWELRVDHPGGG